MVEDGWIWVSVHLLQRKRQYLLTSSVGKWVVACVKDIRRTYDLLTYTFKLYCCYR